MKGTNDKTSNMRGSGEVIGEIEILDLGVIRISDDGCPDSDVRIEYHMDAKVSYPVGVAFKHVREEYDDGVLKKMIKGLTTDKPYEPPSYEMPSHFVCQSCHTTFPGSPADQELEVCEGCLGK